MKAAHARQIRAGIERSRQVQVLLEAINLNPASYGAMALGVLLNRINRAETSALEQRAYLRSRAKRIRAGSGVLNGQKDTNDASL